MQGDDERMVDRRMEHEVIVHDAGNVAVNRLVADNVNFKEKALGVHQHFAVGKLFRLLLQRRFGRSRRHEVAVIGFCA